MAGPEELDQHPLRIVVFDDAEAAQEEYRKVLKGHDLSFRDTAQLNEDIIRRLVEFQPQLMVVDLVMGQSRDDGFDLIKRLRRIRELDRVPIVVCSKLINQTQWGQEVRKRAAGLPGVVAALPKTPYYPTSAMLVGFARMTV